MFGVGMLHAVGAADDVCDVSELVLSGAAAAGERNVLGDPGRFRRDIQARGADSDRHAPLGGRGIPDALPGPGDIRALLDRHGYLDGSGWPFSVRAAWLGDGIASVVDASAGAGSPAFGAYDLMSQGTAPDASIQQSVYRVLASVDALGEKIKDMSEGGKSRDARLETIIDMFRTQGDQIKDLARGAKEQQDQTAIALRDAKHETRNSLQTVTGQIGLVDSHVKNVDLRLDTMGADITRLQAEVAGIKGQSTNIQAKVDSLGDDVTQLKTSIDPLLKMRRQAISLAAVLGSVIAVVSIIGHPMWVWFVEHVMSTLFPERAG